MTICPKCGMPFAGEYCRTCKILEHAREYSGKQADGLKFSIQEPLQLPKVTCFISILDDAEMTDMGRFRVGVVKIRNDSDNDCNLTLTVSLGNAEITRRCFTSRSGGTFTADITLDTTELESEVDLKKTVSVSILQNGIALERSSKSVVFRPYFDMSLKNLSDLSARWTTPNSKAIKDLLLPDGPIADAMRSKFGRFAITGYQGSTGEDILKNVFKQMECVYNALQNLDIDYVSDTFTNDSETDRHQRVKTPRKVLEDKSGNCIELSCLFASIFEAMDLSPVILFPPGHAICGVQLTSKVVPPINGMSMTGGPLPTFVFTDAGTKECTTAVFLETTAITQRKLPFNRALEIGMKAVEDNLKSLNNERISVIAIKRMKGIRPLVESEKSEHPKE